MLEYRRAGRHRHQMFWLVLYVSIAVASMIYAKTVRVKNTDVQPSNTDHEDGKERMEGASEKGGAEDGAEGASDTEDSDGKNAGDTADEKGTDTEIEQSGRILLSVPLITQKDYPTGCESVTSVMALQFAGYDVSVDDFIDQYLRIGKYYAKDGHYYGNSPYSCFIGNPRTGSGFGCFAPVIHEALVKAAGENKVRDLTGMPLDQLVSKYIRNGIPVIVWATMEMSPSYPGRQWTLLETGKEYTWPAQEHCLLLVGADKESYYFNDPRQEDGVTKYEKEVTRNRYQEMGSQALAVLPKQ